MLTRSITSATIMGMCVFTANDWFMPKLHYSSICCASVVQQIEAMELEHYSNTVALRVNV